MDTPLSIKVDFEIELRMITEQDAQPLFELVDQNRLYLRQWLPWLDTTVTVEDELAFIRSIQTQYKEQRGFAYVIWYRGQRAGTIGYHSINWQERKVEIGYMLGEQFQGKGLVTKACQVMVTYAFDVMKLNKVEIRCAVGNLRSRAIPQRLGFTEERVMRQAEWLYNHFEDMVLYGMYAHAWKR